MYIVCTIYLYIRGREYEKLRFQSLGENPIMRREPRMPVAVDKTGTQLASLTARDRPALAKINFAISKASKGAADA